MDNPKYVWNNSLINLKKNLQNNTFKSKYNNSIPQKIQKTYLETSQKFEHALNNLREGLAELSQEQDTANTFSSVPLKKLSYIEPKRQNLRAKTPKRNHNLLKRNLNYLNTSNNQSSSYIRTLDNFSIHSSRKLHNRLHPSISTTRKSSKTGIFNDINNLEIVYNTNINEFSKPKEIIMLNYILKKQNKEFRTKAGEMRHKINELLNNLRLSRMDNQRLNNEKKELIMKISYLENELEINKNMTSNEVELKNNAIEQLKNEIMKLNILLDQKEAQILHLTNNINNLNNINNIDNNFNNKYTYQNQNNNYNFDNEEYNNGSQYYNKNSRNDIKELDDNIDDNTRMDNINNNLNNNRNMNYMTSNYNNNINKNLNSNINKNINNNKTDKYNKNKMNSTNQNVNNLVNQISLLKRQIEQLQYEKKMFEQKYLNNMSNENVNNKNTILENNNLKELNFNLNAEFEKMKSYISKLESTKKNYELQQIDYQNNIKDLNQKLSRLQEDNSILRNKINSSQFQNTVEQNKNSNNNKNNKDNQYLTKIKYLLEKNKKLENEIKSLESQIAMNNNNEFSKMNNTNSQEINYLKNYLEEKNNEISDLKEKIKNLMNQLNLSKNNNQDLNKNNQSLKKEIEQLNIKVSNLESENLNNQQQIFELSNLNNKLQIRVNSVHSGNFKLSSFGHKDNNQELEQQIQSLQQKNDELQEKIMYLSKGNNDNVNIAKMVEEKQNLAKENLDLKNELLILKNQINENENENDYSYNIGDIGENNNSNKVKEMEKQLEEMKNKYETNLNDLNNKQKENQNLLSVIKDKENENDLLKRQISNNLSMNEYKQGNSSNILNIAETKEGNEELKKELLEKNSQIEQLEIEINNIKLINNKIIQENNELKEKIQILENNMHGSPEDGVCIENLKEEIKAKTLQIKKLIEENNKLSKINNNYINDVEDEKEINLNSGRRNENNPFRQTMKSEGLTDEEKIKLYKEQIKEFKMINESDSIQIKALKADIKELKEKNKKMETFSGQLKNFYEFISLLNIALLNYKPKKKEQKDALNRLNEIMKNHHV